MKKCERCGNDAVYQGSVVLAKALGPDGVNELSYRGIKGCLTTSACNQCSEMLERLGWDLKG